MPKPKNQQADDAAGVLPQPPIPAVILIPERRPLSARCDSHGAARAEVYYTLMREFAQRFDDAYVLTAEAGLMPLDDAPETPAIRYEELSLEARHQLWSTVEWQLRADTEQGRRVICLVGGDELKGLRKLRLPFITPLAGMSERVRRLWLQDRQKESNFAVAMSVFPTLEKLPHLGSVPAPSPVAAGR